MGNKSRTKDEKFLIALFNDAKATNDMETPFDRFDVGQKVGLNPKAVQTICVLLLQANFIKKGSGDDVYITPHGRNLVEKLLEE